jgi:hypothetical protein
MRKVLVLAILVISQLLMAIPVQAAWGSWPSDITYNFNAADNEAALSFKLVGGLGKTQIVIKGNEFKLQKKETTVQEVETRIQATLLDDYFIELTNLNTIDKDDPIRQDPPVLTENEAIVTIGNVQYHAFYKCFFKLHIYSIDNLDTLGSELRFVTCFSEHPIDWQYW